MSIKHEPEDFESQDDQSDFLKAFAVSNRLTKEKEFEIYDLMERAVRNKLILMTLDTASIDVLEQFLERVETVLHKSNKLVALIEERAYLTIVTCIDEIKVFAILDDKRALSRSMRRLQRSLIEWQLPGYIAIDCGQQLLENSSKHASLKDAKSEIAHYRRLRNKLSDSNIGLVYKVASRFRYLGVANEDLVQEGSLGLIKAIERFDPKKGFQFSSYAYKVISQQIHAAIEQQSSVVRRPYNELRELALVDQTRRQIEQQLLRAPRGSEFARELPDRVGDKTPHVDRNVQPSADSEAMHVYAPDPELHSSKPRATQDFETQFLVHQKNIDRALRELDSRSEQILRMRFGIGVNRTYTLKEISAALMISGERARQISKQAITKLSMIINDSLVAS